MKKIVLYLLTFTCCFFMIGCSSQKKDATEIYNTTLEKMNKDIYYYKGEHQVFLYQELTQRTSLEYLVDKDKNKKFAITTIDFEPGDYQMVAVFDGTTRHQWDISKEQNTYKYEKDLPSPEKLQSELLFPNIFDDIGDSMPLVNSKVENNVKQTKLYFTFSNEKSDKEHIVCTKYTITIENNYITTIEEDSYPLNNDTLTQRDIITYSNFNTSKTIDTKTVIKEMESYQK